ncbi:Hypothetical_protein [Hexamita inflata]|uniref:Hypothetical_protein n=1 Tax=Hexamita inflata TaxID=28002 RepID=A0AA86P906_9EUKA|nr:Hypothetical protein HINF_LOCUS20858 [Hexamita inflata]
MPPFLSLTHQFINQTELLTELQLYFGQVLMCVTLFNSVSAKQTMQLRSKFSLLDYISTSITQQFYLIFQCFSANISFEAPLATFFGEVGAFNRFRMENSSATVVVEELAGYRPAITE